MMRRLRKRWVWLTIALVVAGGTAAGVALLRQEPPRPVQAHEPDDDTDVIASAWDAGFTFEVTRVACGSKRLITSEERIMAEGVYCLARLDITNEQPAPLQLDLSCQYLIDQEGRRHAMEPDATLSATDQAMRTLLLEGIPPGETLRDGRFIFDVPLGTLEGGVELRGSCDSPGIAVML